MSEPETETTEGATAGEAAGAQEPGAIPFPLRGSGRGLHRVVQR
jgi:hypothetical protein